MSRHTGFASLPLHGGKAPAWLFGRMVRLSREILVYLAAERGTQEILRRLSDPFWFQAFGCVLGFDWHSSGVTTTVCGAVKESLNDLGRDIGMFAAGGKGSTSRKAPSEIARACDAIGCDAESLVYASRMAAKVDSAAVQDGYQLYHHVFFFTSAGDWCVVQQGMSDRTRRARRYHWLSAHVHSFVDEPHEAVCCDVRADTLNLVAHENEAVRRTSAQLSRQQPEETLKVLAHIPELSLPDRHELFPEIDVAAPHLQKILLKTYQHGPGDFEELVGIEGVGPRTLRALALASELVNGAPAAMKDPARFAFAHGGKDGIPFPVDKLTYDRTIAILHKAVNRSAVDRSEKVKAFKRLASFRGSQRAARGGSVRALLLPGVLAALLAIGWCSLVLTSQPLSSEQERIVRQAVQKIDDAGFSHEAFALRHVTTYRASDNWWNAYIGHTNAYAATNFPFEVLTLYPPFFTVAVDDTERAAILLHEARHLTGAKEEGALGYVWRTKTQLGWTAAKYSQTRVWKNTKEWTSDEVPRLFSCGADGRSDCTE